MPSIDAIASDGTSVDIERTIALTEDQARHVASLLFSDTASAVEEAGASLDDFERGDQFPAIRRALDEGEAALAQIAFGEPVTGVKLTLPEGCLWELAWRLLDYAATNGGGGDADRRTGARKLREGMRVAEAGIAIVDQLEATR